MKVQVTSQRSCWVTGYAFGANHVDLPFGIWLEAGVPLTMDVSDYAIPMVLTCRVPGFDGFQLLPVPKPSNEVEKREPEP